MTIIEEVSRAARGTRFRGLATLGALLALMAQPLPASAQLNLAADQRNSMALAETVERWLDGSTIDPVYPVPESVRRLGPLPSPDKITLLAGRTAVARIPGAGTRSDLYLFLAVPADGPARVTAARGLSLDPDTAATFRTIAARPSPSAEDREVLSKLGALVRSDAESRNWYAEQRPTLLRLTHFLLNQPTPRPRSGSGELVEIMEALGVTIIAHRDPEARRVFVPLGGVNMRNIGRFEIGVMNADDPRTLPAIDPDNYLWFEPLGDGWYLYRSAQMPR